jgi:hypothetical protein
MCALLVLVLLRESTSVQVPHYRTATQEAGYATRPSPVHGWQLPSSTWLQLSMVL